MEEVTNIPEWFTDHMDKPTGYLDEVGKLQHQSLLPGKLFLVLLRKCHCIWLIGDPFSLWAPN